MKKLALSLAVLFAVGMVSCGGNKDNNTTDSSLTVGEEVIDITTPGDSATGDSSNTTQIDAVGAAETTTTEATPDKKDGKEEKKDDAAKKDAPTEGETATPEAGK